MSTNKIDIELRAQTRLATESIHDISDSFIKLSKDGKRANTTMAGLTGTMGGLGKVVTGIGLYKLADGMAAVTQSAMDTIESMYLFEASMGDMADSVSESIDHLSLLSGFDSVQMHDAVGSFQMLATSMGVSNDKAAILSETTNRLALDMASLTNRSVEMVQQDFRSGLIGQSKTMYKYGLDVTEAAIKQEALNQGISKSVRHMSQAEKMQLRYLVMLKQSSIAHGVFADTINSPANQMRVLASRFVTLGRAVGTIFLPMMEAVLPVMNAIVVVLTRVAEAIAKLVGYDAKGALDFGSGVQTTGGIPEIEVPDDAVGGMDKLGGSAKKASGNVKKTSEELKKMSKYLMGFDELNVMPEPPKETAGSGGGGGGGGGGGAGGGGGGGAGGGFMDGFDLDIGSYDSLLDKMKNKSDGMVRSILDWLGKVERAARPTKDALMRLWDEGLKDLIDFSFGTLSDFYSSFLVPVGKWVLGPGLKHLIDSLNFMLTDIDFDRLRLALDGIYKALAPFAIAIGDAFTDFVRNTLYPLGVWVVNEQITPFLERMPELIDSLTEIVKRHGEKFFELYFAYLLFKKGLDLVKGALAPFMGLFGGLSGALGGLMDKLGIILAPIESLQIWLMYLLEPFEFLLPILTPITGLFAAGLGLAGTIGVITGVAAIARSLFKAFQQLLDGTSSLSGIFDGALKASFWMIKDAASRLWESIKTLWDSFTRLMDALQPLINLIVVGLVGGFALVIGIIAEVISIVASFAINFVAMIADAISLVIEFFTFMRDVLLDVIVPGLVNGVINFFSGMGESVSNAAKGIKDFVIKMWNLMLKGIVGLFGALWKAISSPFDKGSSVVGKLVDTLSKFISKSWDNIKTNIGSFISGILDNIKNPFDKGKKAVETLADNLRKYISGKWDDIRTTIGSFKDSIMSRIREPFDAGKKNVETIADTIKTGLSGKWDALVSTIKGFKTRIMNSIKEPFEEGKKKVNTALSDAKSWGRNLASDFAQGIRDRIQRVKDAATGLAKAVSDRIGHKSPTKEGPGRDSDKWMPNLIDMLVDGIHDNEYKLESAMEMSVNRMKDPLSNAEIDFTDNLGRKMASHMPKYPKQEGDNIVVKIGERTILDTVTNTVNRENRINGKSIITV